jgi:hypothetical protein
MSRTICTGVARATRYHRSPDPDPLVAAFAHTGRTVPRCVRLGTVLLLAAALLGPVFPRDLHAEVVRVEVESREPVLDGRAFGGVGAYEKLTGWIHFAFDPDDPANANIVDLHLAARNAEGRVEARAPFMVLRPVNPERGRGVALVDVSNRGSKAALWFFNNAVSAPDPVLEEHFGDGRMMRMGLTVIWVGWQWDVVPGEGILHLEAPIARTEDGSPIRGLVRSDWTVDETVRSMPLGHRGPASYEVADPEASENVLTVREGREAPREVVPRDRWRFAREEGGEVIADGGHVYMEEGFQAGRIYELVYLAEDPVVSGIGLAAIRDVISYAKYDETSLFPVRKGVAFGVSQTGRLLRHYLHQGFNTDEAGRQALDGVLIHTGGAGRGSFNHRFAQPSRDAHRYSAFFYPTDLFPFTTRAQRDALTGAEGGLVGPPGSDEHLPLIMQSNSGYEYWGRAASLIHTSVDGRMDVEPLPGERLYHHASAQHFVRSFPGDDFTRIGEDERYRGNPIDFLVTLRALLTRLVEWVDEGKEPPPTRVPRLDEGTLVPIHRVGFPEIPGVSFPGLIHVAYRADYGPQWGEGIVDRQPPELGEPFPSLVARVDGLGNELGGIRSLEVRVPVATYAPWNLREGFPAATDELTDFVGSLYPLPRTAEEAAERGDPRPSLEELYDGRGDYLARAGRAAGDLVEEGFLLEEDVSRVLERAAAAWDWVMAGGDPR